MSVARNIKVRRKPVFFGCEGESEQAYGRVLGEVIEQRVHNVHLEVTLLGEGAGSAPAKIQKALKKIEHYERTRSKFWRKAVLMDSDIVQWDDEQRTIAENLAASHEIRVIWQSPCHEAFLLRHLPNCAQRRPPTSAVAKSALIAQWQEYQKPMSRYQLGMRISSDSISQAISVENEFRLFLSDIGW